MGAAYFWEDLEPNTTWKLGEYLLTEREIIDFATRFDPQPFHVDPVQAKSSAIGCHCASGSHTYLIAQRLTFDVVYSKIAVIAGVGVDKIRFLRPVLPNDVLSGVAKVLSRKLHPSRRDRGFVVIGITATNLAGECMATMETTILVFRKPDTATLA